MSQTQRQAANEWYDHTLYSRLRSADQAPTAREPALGRDPGDDLAGHVLTQERWEVVRLPAIATLVTTRLERDRMVEGTRSLFDSVGCQPKPDSQPLR